MNNKKNLEQNLEQPKEKKCCKVWKKIIIVLIILAVIFFIWFLTLEGPKSAQEEWISNLSQKELDAIHAINNKANVPTRTTPEQTYAALKEALKKEDVEAVTECFIEEKRGEWRDVFEKAKNADKLKNIADDLPEKIDHNDTSDMQAYYSIPQEIEGKIFKHPISFVKDNNGDWKIENL